MHSLVVVAMVMKVILLFVQIAQHLKEMGDNIEQQISDDFRKLFEDEFHKNSSVFNLAYEGFSQLCLRGLASVQNRIHSGWVQVYLLYYGMCGEVVCTSHACFTCLVHLAKNAFTHD